MNKRCDCGYTLETFQYEGQTLCGMCFLLVRIDEELDDLYFKAATAPLHKIPAIDARIYHLVEKANAINDLLDGRSDR